MDQFRSDKSERKSGVSSTLLKKSMSNFNSNRPRVSKNLSNNLISLPELSVHKTSMRTLNDREDGSQTKSMPGGFVSQVRNKKF